MRWPHELDCETQVLNNGHFIVIFNPELARNEDGTLKAPPKLYVLWYDLESDTPKAERISFKAAEALNPVKFAEAMTLLEQARNKAAIDAAIEKEEQ